MPCHLTLHGSTFDLHCQRLERFMTRRQTTQCRDSCWMRWRNLYNLSNLLFTEDFEDNFEDMQTLSKFIEKIPSLGGLVAILHGRYQLFLELRKSEGVDAAAPRGRTPQKPGLNLSDPPGNLRIRLIQSLLKGYMTSSCFNVTGLMHEGITKCCLNCAWKLKKSICCKMQPVNASKSFGVNTKIIGTVDALKVSISLSSLRYWRKMCPKNQHF